MRVSITAELIRSLKHAPPAAVHAAWAKGQAADVYDVRQPQLVLRARPSGVHSFIVRLARGKWHTLGKASKLTPEKARGLAQKALGDVAFGKDPSAEKKRQRQKTVAQYLTSVYTPWLVAHRKTGAKIAATLTATFADTTIGRLQLDAVTPFHLERWRKDRLATVAPKTTNIELSYLKAMLTRAHDWGHAAAHGLKKVKALRVDATGVLRFLSADEEKRLRDALTRRDADRREARESANLWRLQRGYEPWPPYGTYTDILTPLVLVALNTGLRFGELTGLRWTDVELTRQMLTVRSEHAKSGRARHVPLNTEAGTVLASWRPAPCDVDAYVFQGVDGARLTDVKTAWARLLKAASITGFRFHDVRHTFASNLVMKGVDLNTVRELLGHADIKMTLRYSHLSPGFKAAAVARLVQDA